MHRTTNNYHENYQLSDIFKLQKTLPSVSQMVQGFLYVYIGLILVKLLRTFNLRTQIFPGNS